MADWKVCPTQDIFKSPNLRSGLSLIYRAFRIIIQSTKSRSGIARGQGRNPEETMRISLIAFVAALFIFSLVNIACQVGNIQKVGEGTQTAQDDETDTSDDSGDIVKPGEVGKPGEAGVDEQSEEAVDPEGLYFTGMGHKDLLAKWEEIGEDPTDLGAWIKELIAAELAIGEWHLSEMNLDEPDEYTMTLDSGLWEFGGWGGSGIIDLDMTAYGSGGEEDILDEDTLDDNNPVLNLKLKQETYVTLIVESYEMAEDVTKGNYCWFVIYNPEG